MRLIMGKKIKKGMLILFVLILSVSCSQGNTIQYPSNLRLGDYSPCDYNLIWLQTYDNGCGFPFYNYYGIVNVPLNDFLACRFIRPGIGAGSIPVVYMHHDKEISPIDDWNVDYLELLTIDYSYFDSNPRAVVWNQCGQSYVHRQFGNLDSNTSTIMVEVIKECKQKLSPASYETDWNEIRSFKEMLEDSSKNCILSIRIHFQEYLNIVMDLKIIELNSEIYIIYKTDKEVNHINEIHIPVPENIKMFIFNIAIENGLELQK